MYLYHSARVTSKHQGTQNMAHHVTCHLSQFLCIDWVTQQCAWWHTMIQRSFRCTSACVPRVNALYARSSADRSDHAVHLWLIWPTQCVQSMCCGVQDGGELSSHMGSSHRLMQGSWTSFLVASLPSCANRTAQRPWHLC